MKESVFNEYCQLIHAESGIRLNEDKVNLLTNRIRKRMRALGCNSEDRYLEIIKDDLSRTELTHLIDAISTNLTYFFREERHFQFLEHELRNNFQRKPLRIWCAASSSGEEPYSLAMTIREAIADTNADAKILATDICTTVLNAAHVGHYGTEQVSKIPDHLLNKYFSKLPGEQGDLYSVKQTLRELVIYKRLNLSSFPYPLTGGIDFIFCRNVMIYFDNTLRQKMISEFYRLLRPGGYLCVGHSESLSAISHSLEKVDSAIYRKPGGKQ